MLDPRTDHYAAALSRLIRIETVSQNDQSDKSVFYRFHDLLRELFPALFAVCRYENFDGSFLLHWYPLIAQTRYSSKVINFSGKMQPFSTI